MFVWGIYGRMGPLLINAKNNLNNANSTCTGGDALVVHTTIMLIPFLWSRWWLSGWSYNSTRHCLYNIPQSEGPTLCGWMVAGDGLGTPRGEKPALHKAETWALHQTPDIDTSCYNAITITHKHTATFQLLRRCVKRLLHASPRGTGN